MDQDLAHRSFLVQPDGSGAVTVSLPPTADCAAPGAFCTAEGGRLETGIATRIAGPPASLSVADATVEEASGAVLEFAVTLNPRSTRAVTVDYATSDATTTAGADYVHTEGTLRFATGETSKTVRVEVIDDSHDEGEETLTLTLSNVSGGHIADGTATGTIENSDPLPRALMARFGRTAAVHVVEHVEERLQAPRAPGFRGRFAGRELRRGMERDMALSFLNQLGGGGGLQSPGGGVHGTAMAGSRIAGAPGTPGLGGVAGMPGVAGGAMGGGGMMRQRRKNGQRRNDERPGRARRRAVRRRAAVDGPGRRQPADRLGLRAQPRDQARRDPLVLEPGGAVALHRPGGRRAIARRQRADNHVRGRLPEGAARDGPVAVAQPGPGRVRSAWPAGR